MISITQDFNLYIYNLIIYYVQPNRMSYQHLWLTVIDYQILPTSRTFTTDMSVLGSSNFVNFFLQEISLFPLGQILIHI
jgi:hypothetical protein